MQFEIILNNISNGSSLHIYVRVRMNLDGISNKGVTSYSFGLYVEYSLVKYPDRYL